MKKLLATTALLSVSFFSHSAPITMPYIPPSDFSQSNRLAQQSRDSYTAAAAQFGNTLTQLGESMERSEYFQIAQRIREAGGDVVRRGNDIYITNPDGSQMYCYRTISSKTCDMAN